ncbi:hypothetical protein AAFF_G00154540 [Aldrovandia affinis]|uniref:Uncharacterized protein n=1 Tax=Aldrovandia affinis TaxID=143900 RepID=A0AAD7T1U4_9TELE|nr:hypothetical protein AAFF_G00154540 [Aldrovandia affinis]
MSDRGHAPLSQPRTTPPAQRRWHPDAVPRLLEGALPRRAIAFWTRSAAAGDFCCQSQSSRLQPSGPPSGAADSSCAGQSPRRCRDLPLVTLSARSPHLRGLCRRGGGTILARKEPQINTL